MNTPRDVKSTSGPFDTPTNFRPSMSRLDSVLRTSLALLLAISLVGCAKKTPPTQTTIVGTWAQIKEGSLVNSGEYYTFGKDGRFETGTKLEMKGEPLFGSELKTAGMAMTGAYHIAGEKVIIVFDGLQVKTNGTEMAMPNPNAMLEKPPEERTHALNVRMVGDEMAIETETKGEQRFRRVTPSAP